MTVRLSANESLEKPVSLALATGVLRVVVQAADREFDPFMPTKGFLVVDNAAPMPVDLPYSTELLPGVHEIKLTAPGFEMPMSNTATLEIDKRTETLFRLRPLNSSVVFITDIKNDKVKIYANSRYLGRAGEEVFLAPFIGHEIWLKAKGFKDQYKHIVLPVAGKKHSDVFVSMGAPVDGFWQKTSDWFNDL